MADGASLQKEETLYNKINMRLKTWTGEYFLCIFPAFKKNVKLSFPQKNIECWYLWVSAERVINIGEEVAADRVTTVPKDPTRKELQ